MRGNYVNSIVKENNYGRAERGGDVEGPESTIHRQKRWGLYGYK